MFGALVQVSVGGGTLSWVAAARAGLVFPGCGGGCGCCAGQVDGSCSNFLQRQPSAVASLHLWSWGLGVRPRPMDYSDGFISLLRAGVFCGSSKPSGNRAPSDRGRSATGVGDGGRQWRSAADSGEFGLQRFQVL